MNDENASLVLRAVLSLGRRLRAERAQGSISLSAIGILATLSRTGPLPANSLAAEERLQPQSLTRLLAGLERDGLVARTRGDTDRRQTVIALTPAGRRALKADMKSRRTGLEAAAAGALTKAESAQLVAAAEPMLKLALHMDGAARPPTTNRGRRTQVQGN